MTVEQTTKGRNAMTTMTMPGFTADVSLYKTGRFGRATVTASQNTTERVQPAMISVYGCFWLGVRRQRAFASGDDLLVNFIDGLAMGAGC
jgi:hypothetical protein